jgi:hypothetical protein
MNTNESKENRIVNELCKLLNTAELNQAELISIVTSFLFSVGASVAKCGALQSSEDVLLQYSREPTLGHALMAQALWMKETWIDNQKRKDNEDGTKTDAVQDL